MKYLVPACAAVLLAAMAGRQAKADISALWTNGSADGLWGNLNNWSPGVVPNGGYSVEIAAAGAAHVNGSYSINSLTVDSGATLIIDPNQSLSINGPTVTNNGLIQVDNLGAQANLHFTGSTLLTGTGRIMLDDYSPQALMTADAGAVVTQDVNHAIDGTGLITVGALANNGTINADFSGRSLVLNSASMSNAGTLEATNGGTLSIVNVTLNNAGGTITRSGAGSAVSVSGSSITGGTIAGDMTVAGSSFADLTIGAGATVVVSPNTALNIGGTTLTNNGTIQVDTLSAQANLHFTSSVLLTGTGSVFLDDYSPSALMTSDAGAVVTQDVSHTIYGMGDISAALVNNGTVNANQLGHQIVLEGAAKTNNALMEATSGGTLLISSLNLTQGAAGVISSGAASALGIVNSAISGGKITGPGSVSVSNSSFTGVAIDAGTTVIVQPNTSLNIAGPTLVNNGVIQVDTLSAQANLHFTSSTTISGTGSIFLDDYSLSALVTTDGGATVTSGQLIHGIGEISASLVNNATVAADQAVGNHTLFLDGPAKTNNATMEAVNTGILTITGTSVTQGPNGIIFSDAGSAVNIINSAIVGGTIGGTGSVVAANSSFSGVKIDAGTTVVVQPNTGLNIVDGATLINNGVIQVDTLSAQANLHFTNSTTVTGTGSIFLNDNNPNALLTSDGGAVVTQDVNHTIYGLGEISAAFVNNGKINANVANRSLIIDGPGKTNNALIESTGGAALVVSGTTITQGAAGVIQVDAGSSLAINNAQINAGKITGGGSIVAANSNFSGVTIDAGTTVVVQPNTALNIVDGATMVNNGVIQVDTFSAQAVLRFTNSTTVTGSGSIFLDDTNPSALLTSDGGAVVTQDVNHKIYGQGEISAALVNNGLINANQNGKQLIIDGPGKTNNALIESTGGGALVVSGTTITQGAPGVIQVGVGSSLTISNAQITAGKITGGGSIVAANSNFSGVTIDAGTTVVVQPNTALNIVDGATLTNNGVIQVDAFAAQAVLHFTNSTTVTGTGTIVMDDNNPNALLTADGGAVVTQDVHHSIVGIGEVSAALVNNGTVNANDPRSSHTLFLDGAGKTNNGVFKASNGGTLAVAAGVLSNLAVDGTLTGGTYEADANSTVNLPAPVIANAAKVVIGGPGASFTAAQAMVSILPTGELDVVGGSSFAVTGDLVSMGVVDVDSTSTLAVPGTFLQIPSGEYVVGVGTVGAPAAGAGLVNVGGLAMIGGTLDVVLTPGFVPFDGEQFTILTSAGLTGAYDNVILPDGFTVTYTQTSVILNGSAVPEPGMAAMFLPVAGMALRRRRR